MRHSNSYKTTHSHSNNITSLNHSCYNKLSNISTKKTYSETDLILL